SAEAASGCTSAGSSSARCTGGSGSNPTPARERCSPSSSRWPSGSARRPERESRRSSGVGSAGVPAFPVKFEHGRAVAIEVAQVENLPAAMAELGLGAPQPVVVVVGGASGLDDVQAKSLESLAVGIVDAAAACGAAIVDGGTDA